MNTRISLKLLFFFIQIKWSAIFWPNFFIGVNLASSKHHPTEESMINAIQKESKLNSKRWRKSQLTIEISVFEESTAKRTLWWNCAKHTTVSLNDSLKISSHLCLAFRLHSSLLSIVFCWRICALLLWKDYHLDILVFVLLFLFPEFFSKNAIRSDLVPHKSSLDGGDGVWERIVIQQF